MVKYLVFLAMWISIKNNINIIMLGKDIYINCGTVGLTEWPDGKAGRSNEGGLRYTMGEQHPDGCPMEGGRAPDRGGQVPDGGRTGARRRAGVARWRVRWVPDGGRGLGGWPNGGSRGWPNGGLYKCCWPSFLGTLLLRPVAPARNAGAQGANE
jgi:hypothetical protein